jgi:hypothetical protein
VEEAKRRVWRIALGLDDSEPLKYQSSDHRPRYPKTLEPCITVLDHMFSAIVESIHGGFSFLMPTGDSRVHDRGASTTWGACCIVPCMDNAYQST